MQNQDINKNLGTNRWLMVPLAPFNKTFSVSACITIWR